MPASMIYLTNVTESEIDDTCGMRYWFTKHEAGKGILKRDTIVSLLLDTEIHNDLKMLAEMKDISSWTIQGVIDDVLAELKPEDKQDVAKMELLYRRLGWFAAFALFLEPALRAEYETIPIDSGIVLDKDPLWVVAYPDRLLRNRATGYITYREYAPMGPSLTQERWLSSWRYNIRLHVGLAAAAENIGDPTTRPVSAHMIGLSRGFKSALNNRLVHPYVWGYQNKATGEWTSKITGKSGDWTLTPVWEFSGGIVSWVRTCGLATAEAQFAKSPEVFLNRDILDTWAGRRLHREREMTDHLADAKKNIHLRSIYFGQRFSECTPVAGEVCPFVAACWDKTVGLRPAEHKLYTQRLDPSLFGAAD